MAPPTQGTRPSTQGSGPSTQGPPSQGTSSDERLAALDSTAELSQLLSQWESDTGTGADPIPMLTSIAVLVEKETEAYLKMDPDPFDDRHPSRAHPDCALGHLLKVLFKNEEFMGKLVNNYVMHRDSRDMHTIATRLLLDILPGLETSVVFQDTEGLVQRLFQWAENAPNPLRSYATGLLAAAMEVQDIATNFREQNSHLVPVMLKRLHQLNKDSFLAANGRTDERPFAHLNGDIPDSKTPVPMKSAETKFSDKKEIPRRLSLSPGRATSPFNCHSASNMTAASECSNSSWADLEPYMIGSFKMFPLSVHMQQRLILMYLTPMGEYQEVLSTVFEYNAMALIFHYINLTENHDVRLAFESLKYLAALLCHKKFAIEFVNMSGVQRLLEVYRPSVAATGVSICLYYLAYNEDAMERVCLLPQHVLADLVRYALWLLECSHDSSRCHATMFFGLTFAFRVILELFDGQDGLRKLFNMMSTLDMCVAENSSAVTPSDDQVFANRQTARHVCVALKRYYEAHLAIRAEQLRRTHSRNQGGSPNISSPPYKASRFSNETVQENVETLLELMPLRVKWDPVDELLKLGGIQLLLQLIAMSYDWNYSGRAETVRAALDVLNVCSVTPKTQLTLCEGVKVPDDPNHIGISIVLATAVGEVVTDPDVQRSALNVIMNCVCGPMSRLGGSVGKIVGGSVKKRSSMKNGEDLLSKMWNCIRSNNGIMILLNLLSVKTPITDADSVRALACKALCGLARSDTVKQIISKLPLFTSGQLQVLMREPVLQDKRQEHIKFCKHALELIERVTGTPLTTGIESSISKINKAEVVAQTKILYNEKELLQLIHQHLIKKGLQDTALTLIKEASLPHSCTRTNSCSISNQHSGCVTPTSTKIIRPIMSSFGSSSSSHHNIASQPYERTGSPGGGGGQATSSPSSLLTSTPPPPTLPGHGPIKLIVNKPQLQMPTSSSKSVKVNPLQKTQSCLGTYQQSPVMRRQGLNSKEGQSSPGGQMSSNNLPGPITLDSIVTEYLRKQHSLCKDPVVTCPSFDLFVPHQCPEPQYLNVAPTSITARIQRRTIHPKFGGYDGAKMNRKYIYSRFSPVRTFRDSEGSSSFTCCAFSPCDQFLFLGTLAGELKVYKLHSATEETTYSCHESEVTHCEASRDGKLLLTSSAWRRPLSALWTFTDIFETRHTFQDEYYVEFSKHSQDRIIGTKYESASIYDTGTGQQILSLHDSDLTNNYTKNRATFDPTDELVLSNGVLWDVRSGQAIHKFDKFNPHINGVFHPNGLEIISNSEIWDLRTFHLLHTVPALDQCQITFTHMGDVIYGAVLEEEEESDEDQVKSPYGSSFRTFDSTDYSSIATIDIKKNIFDLATDKTDGFLAVVENQMSRDGISSSDSICRLYEVGRRREEDDEDGDDDDDEESEEMDEESDDDADDDDEDEEAENDNEPANENENANNSQEEEEEEDDAEDVILTDDSDDEAIIEDDSSEDDNVLFALNTI